MRNKQFRMSSDITDGAHVSLGQHPCKSTLAGGGFALMAQKATNGNTLDIIAYFLLFYKVPKHQLLHLLLIIKRLPTSQLCLRKGRALIQLGLYLGDVERLRGSI